MVDAGFHYGNYSLPPTRVDAFLRTKSLYVSRATGNDVNDGEDPNRALSSVRRALQMAAPGHRIVLLPGVYSEGELTFPNPGKPGRPIILQALRGAVIDATGSERGLLVSAREYLVIDGLEIKNANNSGIEIRNGARFVTLKRVHLHDNGRRGLYVNNATEITLRSALVERNGSRGIQVESGQLTVTDSSVRDNGAEGLWAASGASVAVVGSEMFHNGKAGVVAQGSSVTMRDSTVGENQDDGVRFLDGTTASLDRVQVANNVGAGVQGVASTIALTATTVQSNLQKGVGVQSGQLTVTDSSVRDNGAEGLWAASGASVVVVGSEMFHNGKAGVVAQGSNVTMRDSTVGENQDDGVRFLDGTTASLDRVQVANNVGAGVQGVASTIALTATTVLRNLRGGIDLAPREGTPASGSLSLRSVRICENRGPGISTKGADVTATEITLCQNAREGLRHSGGLLDVRKGTVVDNVSKGISVSTASAVTLRDISVGNNGDNGMQIIGGGSTWVGGCVSYGNRGDGITVLDSPAPVLWNNLVYQNSSTGILIAGEVIGSANAQVLNNTFYGNNNRGLLIGGSDLKPPSAGALVLRNIFHRNGTAGIQVNRLSLPGYFGNYNLSTDPYGPGTPIGPNDILVAEAGFVDESAGNFRLRQRAAGQSSTSPAVDAGGVDVEAAGLSGLTTRSDGVADTGPADLGFHYTP
ncbi:MAG: hypothetical protein KatS3mg109_2039 [Pirellulaceae bacterium]|nr:MAG: hypothetical protein KatS3mg109_2039 [Pirellulaceae bacterium]